MLRLICTLFTLIPFVCQAAGAPYEKEEAQIPKMPSQPRLMRQKQALEIPHCERYFVYQGKILECDSNTGRDAERLRQYMLDVPAATAELDIYQENRQKMKLAAYLGTAGFIAAFIGGLLQPPAPTPENPEPGGKFLGLVGATPLGGAFILGGILIGGTAVTYSFVTSVTNEQHIGNAVEYYNRVHPNRPIELKFSAEINF
jgi:hypothetical protein